VRHIYAPFIGAHREHRVSSWRRICGENGGGGRRRVGLHGTVFGAVRIGLGCKQVQRLLFLSFLSPDSLSWVGLPVQLVLSTEASSSSALLFWSQDCTGWRSGSLIWPLYMSLNLPQALALLAAFQTEILSSALDWVCTNFVRIRPAKR
jgi:hypothetical protein